MLLSFNEYHCPVHPQETIDSSYVAAIYSIKHDYSKIEAGYFFDPVSTISHKYFIQYGEDIHIELTDPGSDMESFPVLMHKYDYSKGVYLYEVIFNSRGEVYSKVDSIPFLIEEYKGWVETLCVPEVSDQSCDSMKFTWSDTSASFVLLFEENIPNIKSYKLFYPDIDYLPSKIVALNSRAKPKYLEEVVYGKESIDTLLNLFSHENYFSISEQVWQSNARKFSFDTYKHLLPDSTRIEVEAIQEQIKSREKK